jgi:hypothetical protein
MSDTWMKIGKNHSKKKRWAILEWKEGRTKKVSDIWMKKHPQVKQQLQQKLCWVNLSYWLPDIQVEQLSFEEDVNSNLTIFPKKCHIQIISHVQWWTKTFHQFLDSTDQECIIFAKIGDGPCYYHWNEIFAGVILTNLKKQHMEQ